MVLFWNNSCRQGDKPPSIGCSRTEISASLQDPAGLFEKEGWIRNVLKRPIANNEIDGVITNGPVSRLIF
jgi:hypothetical protein